MPPAGVAIRLVGARLYPVRGAAALVGLKGSGSAVTGNGIVADYFGDNSSCPTYLAIDRNNNLWTWDNGNTQLINSSSQDVNAISLSLFSTNDGSLTGDPTTISTHLAVAVTWQSTVQETDGSLPTL